MAKPNEITFEGLVHNLDDRDRVAAAVATGNNLDITDSTNDTVIQSQADTGIIKINQYDGYTVAQTVDGGGFAHNKRVVAITEALDLSSVATALPYSGAVFTIDADGGAYALTLPTATSAAEASQVLGWHATFILTDVHATNDITVVRGDTGNDTITSHGIHVVDGATGDALTIGSNVITFDASGGDAVGDSVEVTCIAASATVTAFAAKAFIGT